MKPISFPESNRTLLPPDGGRSAIESLPVLTDGEQCISCWELSDEEREAIARGEKVWLHVLSGQTQPPVALYVSRNRCALAGQGDDGSIGLAT